MSSLLVVFDSRLWHPASSVLMKWVGRSGRPGFTKWSGVVWWAVFMAEGCAAGLLV